MRVQHLSVYKLWMIEIHFNLCNKTVPYLLLHSRLSTLHTTLNAHSFLYNLIARDRIIKPRAHFVSLYLYLLIHFYLNLPLNWFIRNCYLFTIVMKILKIGVYFMAICSGLYIKSIQIMLTDHLVIGENKIILLW